MIENYNKNEELKFKELSPEEKSSRGILGRLYGPIASVVKSTRNGRKYTESLWDKVFSNPITKEMFSQGGIPGELDHPVDREETDSSKIAIMMPEAPKKDNNGNLIGYFDIIDTPCGKIAYALAKYGFNLGISSRGSGETYLDDNGDETVDEDTYSFNAFDLVLLPACEAARLKLAESVDMNKVNFKRVLKESLENASDADRKIMSDTLHNLDIDLETSEHETEGEDDAKTNKEDADNVGADLVKDLQESLVENKNLKEKLVELQEKLSVGYAKEIKNEQQISLMKQRINNLVESKGKVDAMEKECNALKLQLEEKTKVCEKLNRMTTSFKNKVSELTQINENMEKEISSRDTKISSLTSKVEILNEKLTKVDEKHNRDIEKYHDELSKLKEEFEIKKSQADKQLKQSKELVERYKKSMANVVDKYISSKAIAIGVTTNEIKNRLTENYSLKDIDEICESLKSYKRNISKLPFSLNEGSSISKVTSSGSETRFSNPDDIIDSDLMNYFT